MNPDTTPRPKARPCKINKGFMCWEDTTGHAACHALTADPDLPCPHQDFSARVDAGRITRHDGDTEVIAYEANVRVECALCGEPFRWIGLEAGSMPDRPMVSVDEKELRAPIRPASADPDFGLGIPGFAVTQRVLGAVGDVAEMVWRTFPDHRNHACRINTIGGVVCETCNQTLVGPPNYGL